MKRLRKYLTKIRGFMNLNIFDKYDIIKDGIFVFTCFADIYGDKIDDSHKAEIFFKEFMKVTGGQVILDFLDADNDDHIETVTFDHTEGVLKICTRIPEKDPELRQMRRMALPYDTYSLLVRFKDMYFARIKDNKCIAIVVNGYTMKKKQIKNYAKSKDVEIIAYDEKESFFTSNLLCKKDGLYEYMRVMKTPISSFWIIPKGLHLSANDSEHFLYLYNLESLKKRMDEGMTKLCNQLRKTKDKEEIDGFVKMYGNLLRTIAEAMFKLVMCFYHEKYDFKQKNSEYNDRLLGDLTSPLKKYVYTTENDKEHIEVITRVANELSHDTGLPVDFKDLGEMYIWLKYYMDDFKNKIDAHDNEPPLPLSTRPSPHDFVVSNIHTWDFSHLIKDIGKAASSKCAFLLRIKPSFAFVARDEQEDEYLCKDGKIHTLNNGNKTDALVIPNRECLLKLKQDIYNCIKSICQKEGLDTDSTIVEISTEYTQCEKPTHLFTFDEIKAIMGDADDGVNNKLVIDEEGNARLIQNPLHGNLYPVSIETWGAGNHYVGKDSSLDDAAPSYRLCLSLWLSFLQTGKRQYDDYYTDIDVDETINEIKRFY